MRATTTTPSGPVVRRRPTSSRHPSGRRDSHKRWTSRRGPLNSYNANNQLCTDTSTCSGSSGGFTYDANGNQTAGGGHTSYAYNTKDQTTAVDSSGGYAYSDIGQTERTAGDSNTYANWLDGQQYTKTGSDSTVYIRHPSGLLLSARYFAGGTGSGVSFYFHVDPVTQNVLSITDGSKTKVAGYSYDPYGKVDNASGSYSNPYRSSQASKTPAACTTTATVTTTPPNVAGRNKTASPAHSSTPTR